MPLNNIDWSDVNFWTDQIFVFWRHINPSSVRSQFHLSRAYCKNYTLCLHNYFKKDSIALQSVIPAIKELYPNNNFSFIQDSAPFHRAKITQNFLRKELKSRFVANRELPLSSTDCNLLNYYFRNEVKEKGYIGHNAKHFESEKKYRAGFSLCTTNFEPLRKARNQFLSPLKDIVTKEVRPIKTAFGYTFFCYY